MEDLISQLPDELLQLILLKLKVPTRNSAMTSVLSTRWRDLWKGVPGLNLTGDVYTNIDVKEFLERFLNLHDESSPIHQFTLICKDKDYNNVHGFSLKWLIDKVITHGVQCFAIDCSVYIYHYAGYLMNLPISLYKCKTLVHLSLNSVELNDCEVFYLPLLETMHLESVQFHSELVLEMLILCSPVLQALSIHFTLMKHFTLRSDTVNWLSLRRCASPSRDGRVVIDIPNLEILSIRDNPLESFCLESVSSSCKMCIDTCPVEEYYNRSRMQAFHDFFVGISGVTDLTISNNTLKGLYPHSQPHQLPNFENLTHLNACFNSNVSKMLPMFLSCCHNLKSLDLELCGYPKTKEIANSPVPRCFQTSIEYVEVKMTSFDEEINRKAEIEFAEYILENATSLKTFILWLDGEEDESSSVLQRILTFQNRSLVEVKMNQRPAKFLPGYGFNFKSVFDPSDLFCSRIVTLF